MLGAMDVTFGIVTDVHFGPEASFDGKVRKLTAHAPALLTDFVRRMNEEVRPDLVVNLGDDIEDQDHDADKAAYGRFLEVMSGLRCDRHHVAGNHDLVHLSESELLGMWGRPPGKLYYAVDLDPVRFIILATRETKDVAVHIDAEQLSWLSDELAKRDAPAIVLMHHTASEQDVGQNRWFSQAPHLCKVSERKKLRRLLRASGKVIAVFNGHLHWNHFDLCDGIPYITLQSLVENLDDDAPGRPAAAHAVVRLTDERISIEVAGNDPARYQIDRAAI